VTLLAAVTSAGFRDAVLVYLAVAFVSFVAAGSIFWRRRRQAGRHTGSALMLAMFVAAMALMPRMKREPALAHDRLATPVSGPA